MMKMHQKVCLDELCSTTNILCTYLADFFFFLGGGSLFPLPSPLAGNTVHLARMSDDKTCWNRL